jgi:NADH-quinone oxidoreductase subunit C
MNRNESIKNILTASFGAACLRQADYSRDGFHLRLGLQQDQCRILAELMREAGFYLEYVTAVDRFDHLELIYVFGQYGEHLRIQAIARVAKGEKTPSISPIFPSAAWHEREVYDFFGQIFTDHPDLKHILLPEDADYHPLLKDFKAPLRLNGERGPVRL